MLPIGWFPQDGNKAVYYFNIVNNSFVCSADTGIQAQSLLVSDLGQHFETSQFSFVLWALYQGRHKWEWFDSCVGNIRLWSYSVTLLCDWSPCIALFEDSFVCVAEVRLYT